jgi:predicted HAD superfamily Cof-like phosphohydrolase
MTNFEKVKEFREAFGRKSPSKPIVPAYQTMTMHLELMEEELAEITAEFCMEPDTSKIAKELSDLLYVIYDAGAAFGIDMDASFDRVHQSNMSKLGEDGNPIYREDGKVLKGPGYLPPDMSSFRA